MSLALASASNQAVYYGDILDSVLAGVDSQWSLAYRVNYQTVASNQINISKLGDGSFGVNQRQMFAGTSGSTLRFITYYDLGALKYRGVTGGTLAANTDYAICWAYDGSLDTNNGLDRFSAWINGVPVTLSLSFTFGSLGDIQTGTSDWCVGGQHHAGSTIGISDVNYIGDVMLSSRVWTIADVSQFTWGNPSLIPNVAFFDPLDVEAGATIVATRDIITPYAGTTNGSPTGAGAPTRRY